jgi:hypothetical protein
VLFESSTAARALAAALLTIAELLVAGPSAAGDSAVLLEEPPRYGIFYETYEPAFYTGFAPRTLEPRRLQIHIGRGNQLRATVVLSDEVLREYSRDLLARKTAYRSLVDSGQLVLTQNKSFEEFERRLAKADVADTVRDQADDDADDVIDENLDLLEDLNPQRVFRIRMPVDPLIRNWVAELRPADRQGPDAKRRLELLNLLLPTRLFLAEADKADEASLAALIRLAPESAPDRDAMARLRPMYLNLLARVSGGIYPVHGDELRFTEFTAIYPIGTWNQFTTHHGRQIPQYPTPGRRALTTHQRTKTTDHVPDELSYSYFPWLPYMHVGTRMHNALHTLFWKMKPEETSFLPAQWKDAARNPDGDRYEYLWLLSRGPMSHGCTHVNGGHISELRQLLPADPARFPEVDVYYNRSYDYDVFDIDGNLAPEVMGVRYFIAYSLKNDRPDRLRVRNERRAYYDWLYAGELGYDGKDRGRFATVKDGRFVGRTAAEGREYRDLALYEAHYEPERIQFYRKVDIPFAKELRMVGVRHPMPRLDSAAARQEKRGDDLARKAPR